MRVITGSAKGRKLLSPEGIVVRPTTEMVKEAIFSILNFRLEQATVLDLFAGSGQMGIEALSRGAKMCVFVDKSRSSQQLVIENLKSTKLFSSARVANMDAAMFLKSNTVKFDIIIADPPYNEGLTEKVLPSLADALADDGIVLCETAKTEDLPEEICGLKKHREYRYGKIKLTSYVKENPDE